jgi:hypothetical protein
MLLGLLQALLFGLARLLLALGFEVVGGGIVGFAAAQQPERSGKQPAQGTTPGTDTAQRSGEGIEAVGVHDWLFLGMARKVDSFHYGHAEPEPLSPKLGGEPDTADVRRPV